MHVPTKEDPDPCRKPDNKREVFEDGDFAVFIKPIVDTLDLYHNQGADPRAIAISFKHLAENNPKAQLEIVAMEKRGKDKFLLRAKTAKASDRSQLSAEYFSDYNQIKALSQNDARLLAEKDARIQSLEVMVMTALKRPGFYAETYHHKGDVMSENSGINVNAGGNVGAVGGHDAINQEILNLGTLSGEVTNAVNQLPDASEVGLGRTKELLAQLQRMIEDDPQLQPENKAEALEQVKVLAEAGRNPQAPEKQSHAKTAIRVLRGMIAELPKATNFVEACTKLLPQIAQVFGLG
jgi:hypothetical protein